MIRLVTWNMLETDDKTVERSIPRTTPPFQMTNTVNAPIMTAYGQISLSSDSGFFTMRYAVAIT